MYLPRNIDKNLLEWSRAPKRSPMILRGARQVGKSASIDQLGKEFSSYVVVDLESSPELHRVFEGPQNPRQIVRDLEAILEVRIIPGETLLFFDEIQECPHAISSMRYFKEKFPELHIVAAGSLLEFVLGEISFPVGRIEYEYLYPMTFHEFLVATDRFNLAGTIPTVNWKELELSSACSKVVSTKLYSALKEYFIVGGMPEAVSTYRETLSYLAVAKVHDRLVRGFRDDIPKYTKGVLQTRNISLVFSKMASSVGQQVTYTKLLDDDPKRNKVSVFLLEQAKIMHLVKAASPGGLPLGPSASQKVFKPLFLDIGLMQHLCGRSAKQLLEVSDLVSSFRGQLAEQFVGQELIASREASESGQLFYWQRSAKSSTAEVDYLLSRNGLVVPIEVKSGSSGRLKSLHLLIDNYTNVPTGLCLQNIDDSRRVDDILFCPLYTRLC
jgi:uncharacterized protein